MRLQGWRTIDKTPVYRLGLRTESERLRVRGVVASEDFIRRGWSFFVCSQRSSFLFGQMRFWHFEAAQVELGWCCFVVRGQDFCTGTWNFNLHFESDKNVRIKFNATKGQPLLRLYEVDTSQ
jgi:hypothetical protein